MRHWQPQLGVLLAPFLLGPLLPSSPRTIERRQTPGHPLHYLVSRPAGWTPTSGWPAIVIIPDAYREFDSTERAFVTTPGADGFVVVTPLVLSGGGPAQLHREDFDYDASAWARADRDGNCGFDEAGIQALLTDLAAKDHVTKVFITGWEAGGHVALAQALDHPERWAGVAVATPNYIGRCVSEPQSTHSQLALQLRIRVFHGDADASWKAGNPLFREWDEFVKEARGRGFLDLGEQTVAGPHGSLAAPVVAYFRTLAGM